tara:strand:- start:199 stop:1194 length:996 start_codon:yes stop_codon:yes gene_type:complete
MALTANRPDYTATQLNTAFTNVRTALAAVLPSRILTVSGTSNFTALDIYDGGEYGAGVLTISDAILALANVANTRKAGWFSVTYDYSIDAYVIEVTGYIRSLDQSDFNKRVLPSFRHQREIRGLRNNAYVSKSNSGFSSNNSREIGYPDKLSLYARVHYFATGATSMGSSFDVNGGLANTPSNALGGYEVYDNTGYEQWNLGVATTITMTAFSTIEMGYEQWNLGTATTLGSIEYFDCGWSEGVRPIVKGVVRIEENVTSQVNGIKTVFTTKRPYKSGTLQAIWNGQVQYEGTVSETSSTTFTTTFTAGVGDVLIITYEQSDGGIERIALY